MKKKELTTAKKIFIGSIVSAAIFAIVVAVIYVIIILNRGKVIVIPVSEVDYGGGGYYANNVEGIVSMGSSQTIMKTSDQQVAELYVNAGDSVTKDQAVGKYSTASYEQQLAQYQLDVQSAQIRLNNSNAKLQQLEGAVEKSFSQWIEEDVSSTDESDDESDVVDKQMNEGLSADSALDDSDDADDITDDEMDVDTGGEQSGTIFVDSAGNSYTPSELRQQKNEVKSEIRSYQTTITEYQNKIAATQKKISDSTIYASMDGVVLTANHDLLGNTVQQTESESDEMTGADDTDSAESAESYSFSEDEGDIILKISSRKGIFVNTYISEFNKTKVNIGDTVYVNAWETGEVYKASITDISIYVSDSYTGDYGSGSSSVSYYPMTVRIEEDNVSLGEGSGVEVSLTKPEDYTGEVDDETEDPNIYLYKAFVADEGGSKYVYISKNGKLIKQKITVSGQESETYIVTSGLSEDDFIAFPYGDNIRVGAKVKEGSISMLYGD